MGHVYIEILIQRKDGGQTWHACSLGRWRAVSKYWGKRIVIAYVVGGLA